ncbi:MAG: MarR family winged helix-turn-helix transcriptional regulator [Actinomycetes bacterium]
MRKCLSPHGESPDPSRFVLDGVDDLSSRVFFAFLVTLRLHKQLMLRTLAGQGTHPGQIFCLHVLAGHDGISQRDLADALRLSRPTVSKMLQAMQKAGAVERRPDAADRRLTRVFLTAAGRDLERQLRGVVADFVNETIGDLPENDRRELARLLGELGGLMSRALARRGPEAAA